MKVKKIEPTLLVHTVYWTRKTLSTKNNTKNQIDNYKIDKVFICPNISFYSDQGLNIQSGIGNFQMFYQPDTSTELPLKENGSREQFAVGDTIKWMQNPNIMRIVQIRPFWDDNTENKISHYEIWLE